MKIQSTVFSLSLFICTARLLSGSVYDYTVPGIEGGTQQLSAYQGKKILVITLPVSQNASADSLLYSLDTLATAHASELKVIAVPGIEDGFATTNKAQLVQWYRSKLGSNILITDGIYTRKTSGTQQHPLFKWLTSSDQNEVFDIDAAGPGYKFISNSSGQLYGVLKPHSKVWGSSVQRTLSIQ
jgi:glutathione peroxidase